MSTMKRTTVVFILMIIASATPSWPQKLRVALDHRHLVLDNGKPFFYLGDTAWELFHRLDREEADLYLANRAQKGFTVVQAVVLAERNGLDEPNAYGDLPLKNKNPLEPNEAYFRHVDAIVNRAEALGLFIGMLPCWGSYWSSNNPGQVIFNPANAREYGRFLGTRYREKPIIWILGGDHNIHNETERRTVQAMAMGLLEGDKGNHLATFHPRGPGFSSDYWHPSEWMDFNMFQSSHGAHDHDNGLFAEHDLGLAPPKPTMDGEPRYEALPVGFYFNGSNHLDRFDDFDCRQAAYWSLLAGSCGHTYGHNSIWQMWAPGREPVLSADIPWTEALDHPGAFQMGVLRKLFESRPYWKLAPNQEIIKDGPDSGGGKIRAALAEDGSFAFVYSPYGEPFTIDKSAISGRKTCEIWFDPRYRSAHPILNADTKGIQTYTPPTRGRGRDWVLIIEDAEKNFPTPGGNRIEP